MKVTIDFELGAFDFDEVDSFVSSELVPMLEQVAMVTSWGVDE